MTTIRTNPEVLVVVSCWCGIQHAVPESLRNTQLRHHNEGREELNIYCPLGHAHVPGGARECDSLKKQIESKDRAIASLRAAHDQTRAELRDTENRRRAEMAAKTKLQRRVAHGVCPCCKRTFKQLAAHMKRKHAEYLTP